MKISTKIKKAIKACVPHGIILLRNKEKKDQNYFERLYLEALAGMNIGGSSNHGASGEQWVLENITNTYKSRTPPNNSI